MDKEWKFIRHILNKQQIGYLNARDERKLITYYKKLITKEANHE